ncbi:SDR family oxidoreductase [Streptomyces sp. 769]|uniref:SDR family NAD(P)-dependent oxidoreductase n=1 Tax=Streptomyces sp. 769 TaxID=1262452 RepID=UPI000581F2DD|nr:SDR family oxidoreductase [Streptomyces sp. 769]AJC62151.1 ketoreductase [Streptomyces sp. 769]
MQDKPVALVTGSSSGIGAAVARKLGTGMRVVVNSARSAEAGNALARELPDATYVQADVADPEQATALVSETVARYGRLDVLVNNAGTTQLVPHDDFAAVTPQMWQEILGVNIVGTWFVTVAAIPHLREAGGGSIVNISSIAGSRVAGSCIPYAVSKAGLSHLTRLLAASVGPQIRVNAVAPGLIDTPWTAGFGHIREQVEQHVPLRRIGTPEDVAGLVSALIEARYTTGEVVLADGGAHLA